MRDDLLIRPKMASAAECEAVIEAFNRCRFRNTHAVGDGFFDHRVMWFNSYPPEERAAKAILRKWQDDNIEVLKEFFDEQCLFTDGIQTVIWPLNISMPPHQDDRHPDGAPHNTPWRFMASVLYLNDSYDGGEIYFPERNYSLKPRRGDLVAFPGAWWHGVRAASAPRYTAIMWHTRDIAYRDPNSVGPF